MLLILKSYCRPDYSPIYIQICQSKEMSHDFVRGQVSATWARKCGAEFRDSMIISTTVTGSEGLYNLQAHEILCLNDIQVSKGNNIRLQFHVSFFSNGCDNRIRQPYVYSCLSMCPRTKTGIPSYVIILKGHAKV